MAHRGQCLIQTVKLWECLLTPLAGGGSDGCGCWLTHSVSALRSCISLVCVMWLKRGSSGPGSAVPHPFLQPHNSLSQLGRLWAVKADLPSFSLCGVFAIWLVVLQENCACVLAFGRSVCEHMCQRSSDVCFCFGCWLRQFLCENPHQTKLFSDVVTFLDAYSRVLWCVCYLKILRLVTLHRMLLSQRACVQLSHCRNVKLGKVTTLCCLKHNKNVFFLL